MKEFLKLCPSFLLGSLKDWRVECFYDKPLYIEFNFQEKERRGKVTYFFRGEAYVGKRLDVVNGKEHWVTVDLEGMLRHLK